MELEVLLRMVELPLGNSVLLSYQAVERDNRGNRRASLVTLAFLWKKVVFSSRESVCLAAWITVDGVLWLWLNLSGMLDSSISLLCFRAASTVLGNCCSHRASQLQPATIAKILDTVFHFYLRMSTPTQQPTTLVLGLRRIYKVSYGGLYRVVSWLSITESIRLFPPPEAKKDIKIVHRRGEGGFG